MHQVEEETETSGSAFRRKCQRAQCRLCGRAGLTPVLDLGSMPLSDGFLTRAQLQQPQEVFPLEVAFCPDCSLVQILETVPPEKLFCEDYPYFSSFTDALLVHSRDNVLALIEARSLGPQSLVVELASNDGYLLKNYVKRGVPVLGIDPAEGPAKVAEGIGVPTLCTFFTRDLADRLAAEGRRADVIHANNVLAHVPDTNGFVQGIQRLLKPDGVAVIEVPYVRDLVDHCEFDTIYHEHLCYFSVTSLDRLFRRNGLFLNDIARLPIHGGSLRLFVAPRDEPRDAVGEMLDQEQQLGLDRPEYYGDFADRVRTIQQNLRDLLGSLKGQGKSIAAYGAAAKGTIMLNYLGADDRTIDFAVDRNTHKQGKFIPGVCIEISDPARLIQEQPDYVMLLPWNFKDEILAQQDAYRQKGGKFIIPIPEPVIV